MTLSWTNENGPPFISEPILFAGIINEYSKKYKFRVENGTPVFYVDLIFFCKFEDANLLVDISQMNPTATIPEEVLKTAENKITDIVIGLFNKLKKAQCDLFEVEDQLYQRYYSYYKKMSGHTLEKLQLKVSVDCQNEKSTRL